MKEIFYGLLCNAIIMLITFVCKKTYLFLKSNTRNKPTSAQAVNPKTTKKQFYSFLAIAIAMFIIRPFLDGYDTLIIFATTLFFFCAIFVSGAFDVIYDMIKQPDDEHSK